MLSMHLMHINSSSINCSLLMINLSNSSYLQVYLLKYLQVFQNLWYNTLKVKKWLKEMIHDKLHDCLKLVFLRNNQSKCFFQLNVYLHLRLHSKSLLTSFLLITAINAHIGNWITPSPKRTQPAAERRHMFIFMCLRSWNIMWLVINCI